MLKGQTETAAEAAYERMAGKTKVEASGTGRGGLGAAISRLQNAEAALEGIRAAKERLFNETIYPTNRDLDRARVALAEDGKSAAGRAASAFLGEGADNAAALQNEVEQLEGRLTEARLVLSGLDQRLPGAERAVEWSKRQRDEALRDVVRNSPELAALIARCEEHKRHVAALTTVLHTVGPLHWPHGYRPETIIEPDYAGEECERWRSAIAALALNADAILPDDGN